MALLCLKVFFTNYCLFAVLRKKERIEREEEHILQALNVVFTLIIIITAIIMNDGDGDDDGLPTSECVQSVLGTVIFSI